MVAQTAGLYLEGWLSGTQFGLTHDLWDYGLTTEHVVYHVSEQEPLLLPRKLIAVCEMLLGIASDQGRWDATSDSF